MHLYLHPRFPHRCPGWGCMVCAWVYSHPLASDRNVDGAEKQVDQPEDHHQQHDGADDPDHVGIQRELGDHPE